MQLSPHLILELVSRYAGSKFRADACSVSKAVYASMIAISMENPIFAKYYMYTTNCNGCDGTSPRHTCKRILELRLSNMTKPRAHNVVKIASDYHLFVRLKIKTPFDISCNYACVDVIKILLRIYFTSEYFDDRLYDNGVYKAIISINKPVVNYLHEYDPRGSIKKGSNGITVLNSRVSMLLRLNNYELY